MSAAIALVQRARAKAIAAATGGEGEAGGGAANSAPTDWSGPVAVMSGSATGALPAHMSTPAAGSAAANSGAPDLDALSSLRPDDYYLELSAPFLEEPVSTSFGQGVSAGGVKRPGGGGGSGGSGGSGGMAPAVAAAVSGSSVLTAGGRRGGWRRQR